MLDFGWHAVYPVAASWRCQRTLPVSASRQSVWRRSNLGPVAAVMNTFLPQTTGEATLRPGRSAFHLTFSVGPQLVGSPVSSDTPDPFGPRNCVQPAAAARPDARRQVARVMRRFMRERVPKANPTRQRGNVPSLARRASGRVGLPGQRYFERHGPAGRVGQPELEHPDLGERLLLVVLAILDQKFVLAGLQCGQGLVLVEVHAVVVLLVGED